MPFLEVAQAVTTRLRDWEVGEHSGERPFLSQTFMYYDQCLESRDRAIFTLHMPAGIAPGKQHALNHALLGE